VNDLSRLHTFGIAASCSRLLTLDSSQDLQTLRNEVKSAQPVLILGSGSNCIFTEDFDGVVALNRLSGVTVEESAHSFSLTVASGENWHELVVFCLERGIYGFENLALIPGTVGAAPIQNIGAYGRELNEFVRAVDYIDLRTGQSEQLIAEECQFGYRNSVFKQTIAKHWFITHVYFEIPKNNRLETSYGELAALEEPTPWGIFETVCAVRTRKLPDPKRLGNAGSFFKNPVISSSHFTRLQQRFSQLPSYRVDDARVKIPAAWLIDQCGFKGTSIGGVRCHPNQPLVLTNTGGAIGADLLSLARAIRDKVESDFNIELENEVRLLGQKGMLSL
jgi:UDP-N-acetylmuramate dehydrogenase